MKKKICILLYIVLVLGNVMFSGCTNGSNNREEMVPKDFSREEAAVDERSKEDWKDLYAGWEIERGWYSQTECDILTDMFENYEDIPSEFRMLVSIPKVKERLPNADKINRKISEDYENVMAVAKKDYNSLVTGFSYPTLMIYYKEFEFDGVYELCIFERKYSTLGSGIDYSVNRYYYDANIKDEITENEFLSKFGYSRDDIIKAFYEYAREVDEEASEETYGYSYEQITYWFHVDENGELEFHTGLWS